MAGGLVFKRRRERDVFLLRGTSSSSLFSPAARQLKLLPRPKNQFHGVHSHLHGSSALSTGRPRWKLPEGSAADLGSSASSRSSTSDFVRERQSNALYWLDVETFQLKQVQPTKAAAAAAAAATAGGGGSPGGPGQAMGSGTGAAHPPGSGSTRSPSGSRGSGSTGTKEGYWPRAVKNHTLSAVEDRYIVCFGGRYPGSEGEHQIYLGRREVLMGMRGQRTIRSKSSTPIQVSGRSRPSPVRSRLLGSVTRRLRSGRTCTFSAGRRCTCRRSTPLGTCTGSTCRSSAPRPRSTGPSSSRPSCGRSAGSGDRSDPRR